MKVAMPEQSPEPISPNLEGFEIKRRPIVGFGLLLSSVLGTFAVLIYFGAWASADRIESRALASGTTESQIEAEWWEDGLVFVCPLH